MSPKYKLTYFDGRGLAEPIRFLFLYMGVEFEDHRMSTTDNKEWAELKPLTPFGHVPILEIDGKQYTQSMPLYRYLGKKAGLAGSNDLEDLKIDIIGDVLNDFGWEMVKVMHETDEEKKKQLTEKTLGEIIPFHFKKFEEIAKQNGGFLANNKLSWADFMFTSIAENYEYLFPEANVMEGYPLLKALKNKILTHPNIKTWVENRKELPF